MHEAGTKGSGGRETRADTNVTAPLEAHAPLNLYYATNYTQAHASYTDTLPSCNDSRQVSIHANLCAISDNNQL